MRPKSTSRSYSNYKTISLMEEFIDNSSKSFLWVYGESGYGKTRLVKNLVQKIEKEEGLARFFDIDILISYIVKLLKRHESPLSLAPYLSNYNLLVFDNLDLSLLGKPKTQEEFRHLILEVIKKGKSKIVLISNNNPNKGLNKLKINDKDCCYVLLRKPTKHQKVKIIKDLVDEKNIFVSKDKIEEIARKSKNLFQLKGLLNKVTSKT